ncbi:MAG: hypothetical protein A2Y75_01445 [Candidatus Solincola sediminis]|uniref:Uncharacterized protein n=1 Tax=Candidatus Solincola sediminis TaxID=1797199 RepID=A0A1F2WNL5_9ACTN|nr:MAG: hypothetical protein A2Y75_01445 [Candidatus Solincola sediminis]
MKLIPSALLAATISTQALASTQPRQTYAFYGRVINAVALSTASSSFTVDLTAPTTNGIFGLMTVWVSIADADNSTTALNMSCTGSHDGGTTDYALQDCATLTNGVCTSVGASWTKDPSGITTPKRWPWRVDIEGFPEVECTFTDTGGAAADSITAYVTFATKG